ncbi:hypothetical protein FB45DRAFT_946536 [Roridomyces roridus]|uniref:DUF6534 domain-containing protein n=1 Tax=Roridomyces roridus TaxID=1738132 RepID=A0AAD7F8A8_9AGAR|nr:hypothetical protein FB45DRAFT_946536 [Roridomyces roridus]
MPSTVLVPTMGASLVGVFVSTFLYGITTLQTYFYVENYWSKDSRGLRYTVALLWLLETAHTALACTFIFRMLILNFGDTEALLFTTVSDDVTHGVLGATIFVVHCFYVWRLWIFTRNIFLAGLVFLLALGHLVFEIVVMAILFEFPAFSEFHRATPFFTTAMTMAVAADIIIAVAMATNLKSKQQRVKETNSLLNKLIAYIVSTGLLTSVVDIIILATFLGMPDNLVYLCFLNFINNFYANSMLAMLNARRSLRNGIEKDVDLQLSLDSMHAARGERSESHFHSRSLVSGGVGTSRIILKTDRGMDNDTEIEITKTVETHMV